MFSSSLEFLRCFKWNFIDRVLTIVQGWLGEVVKVLTVWRKSQTLQTKAILNFFFFILYLYCPFSIEFGHFLWFCKWFKCDFNFHVLIYWKRTWFGLTLILKWGFQTFKPFILSFYTFIVHFWLNLALFWSFGNIWKWFSLMCIEYCIWLTLSEALEVLIALAEKAKICKERLILTSFSPFYTFIVY